MRGCTSRSTAASLYLLSKAACSSLPPLLLLPPAAKGTKVWAYSPPGGMCSASLAHALEGFVTSVAVAKDCISRLSACTFERLLDEVGASSECTWQLCPCTQCCPFIAASPLTPHSPALLPPFNRWSWPWPAPGCPSCA